MSRPTPAVPRTALPLHPEAPVTAGETAAEIVAAPAAGKRRSYLLIQNVSKISTEYVWIRVDGEAATAASPCFLLAPGVPFGGTAHVPQGAISAIRDGDAVGDVPLGIAVEEVDA